MIFLCGASVFVFLSPIWKKTSTVDGLWSQCIKFYRWQERLYIKSVAQQIWNENWNFVLVRSWELSCLKTLITNLQHLEPILRLWNLQLQRQGCSGQGGQIGRIFACWVIVCFGQCFENGISSTKFWANFFHTVSYVLILAKNVLGYILGDFFYKIIWSPWFETGSGLKQILTGTQINKNIPALFSTDTRVLSRRILSQFGTVKIYTSMYIYHDTLVVSMQVLQTSI
jgi:hypothetical protein